MPRRMPVCQFWIQNRCNRYPCRFFRPKRRFNNQQEFKGTNVNGNDNNSKWLNEHLKQIEEILNEMKGIKMDINNDNKYHRDFWLLPQVAQMTPQYFPLKQYYHY